MKIRIETYGCTLNQADSDIMAGLLKSEGHTLASGEDESDIIIVNTCTVKGTTENKIMEKLKKLTRENKKIIVSGCLTVNKDRIKKAAPNASIIGTSSLANINKAIESVVHGRQEEYLTFESKDSLERIFTAPILRVPINDGCTSSCHFCQTKIARPFLRSYTPKTIVKWITNGLEKGAREIQLTSMDSGAYGIDIRTNLGDLLNQIDKIDGNFLLRLGMINPNHAKRLKTYIADAMKSSRIYKFIHIPVQTGSEKVCREMNRDHTVADFVELVKYFRGQFPEISIATDIIVGYPTETENDFEETCKLIEATQPTFVNISKFSPRPGTKAKQLKQMDSAEVKRRSRCLTELVRQIQTKKNMKKIGTKIKALVTEKQKDFTGRDINYNQIVIKGKQAAEIKLGESLEVEVAAANYCELFGMII